MPDPAYEAICERVWALYQQVKNKPVGSGHIRNILFPPPRREMPVDMLIVGISPNQGVAVNYTHTCDGLKDFAHRFEYVTGGTGTPGFHYDSYYGALLRFVRRVDERFGVWWEVERGARQLLVEFTDALHVATEGGNEDFAQFIPPRRFNDPIRQACREILEMELSYYKPKVVIGNGRFPSDLLWEVCTGSPLRSSPTDAMILETRFGCSVHLSGFLPSKSTDAYSKARLVRELQEHTPFRR